MTDEDILSLYEPQGIPDLASARDACDILGMVSSGLPPLRRRDPNFPLPVQIIGSGPVWLRADLEQYAANRASRKRT